MSTPADPVRQLLRHTVATVAYRGGKALRDAPESFAAFTLTDRCRTPAQILAHKGDLFDWALSMARGDGGTIPSHSFGTRRSPVSLLRSRSSMIILVLRNLSDPPPRACFKGPSQTRSRTTAKLPCSAVSRVALSEARTTSRRRLPQAVLASSRPHRAANSIDAWRINADLTRRGKLRPASVAISFLGRIAPLAVTIRIQPKPLCSPEPGSRD